MVRVSTCRAFAHSQRALSITVNRTMFAQVVRAEQWIAKAYANKALGLASFFEFARSVRGKLRKRVGFCENT